MTLATLPKNVHILAMINFLITVNLAGFCGDFLPVNVDPDLNSDILDTLCEYYDQNQFVIIHFHIWNSKLYGNFGKQIFCHCYIWNLSELHDPLIHILAITSKVPAEKNKRVGGVAFYIHDSLHYNIHNDINESGLPVASCNNFTDCLNGILAVRNHENKKCYVLGEININHLNCENEKNVKHFINLIFVNSFYPVINKPTRITSQCATLIDNIITDDLSELNSSILITDSDHL